MPLFLPVGHTRRARTVFFGSKAAFGVWSGCRGQVAPDVKAKQDGRGEYDSRTSASRLPATGERVRAYPSGPS